MAIVTIREQSGAKIRAAYGSGSLSLPPTYPQNYSPVNVTGLGFKPDLIIVYANVGTMTRMTASRYTGSLISPWDENSWGNGSPCIRNITDITDNGFTFWLYPSSNSTNAYNYTWRAFKLG